MADLVVAEELLDTLASLDISVEAAGDTLQLVGPRSALSQELAEEIRRHKPEILAALRTRQSIGQALPGGVTEAQPSLLVAEILAMPVSRFADASLVVEVRSRALDEVVILASNDSVIDPGERRVVYRAAELGDLAGLSPSELRAVHQVKRTSRGVLLPS